MAHKFDVAQKTKLDNAKRREALPPEEILNKLGLAIGDIVADIGCGIGYFSIPAARIVGAAGKVLALDIEEEMLAEVNARAGTAGVSNIETIKTGEYDFNLEDGAVDFVFACLVLHEVDDKKKLLEESSRIVKPGGRLAVLEWIKADTEMGPPKEHRVAAEEVSALVGECGFREVTSSTISGNFYAVTAVK